jgi:prepilin-type N-terminal cleavage/methylation domain-containing protein
MRNPPTASRCAAGFTFIEMMVVIAILSLLASIVVANLDGISAPTKLRGAARAIGNQLLELKEMAALKDRAMSMEIDLEHQRWRIVDAPSAVEIPDPREREDATFVGDWVEPPSGVRIQEVSFSSTEVDSSGSLVITFQADGEVSPSGFVAFLKSDTLTEDEGMSVEVSGLTGLVAYHDGHFKAEEIRRPEDF